MYAALPANRVWLGHSISELALDDSSHLFYIRTGDGRRNLVRQNLQSGLAEIVSAELAPSGNVGYGGGAFAVRGALLVFASGGQLFSLELATGAQKALTPKYEGLAAPTLSPCGRYVAFVIEIDQHAEILLADTAGAALPIKLSAAPAFAANPTFSVDGRRVAWMEWAVNRMPWEQSSIRIATLSRTTFDASTPPDLLPSEIATLAMPNVSFANPQWSPDGRSLAYTSDESGWRSIYVAEARGQNGARIDTGLGEIGLPDWVQGLFAVRWSHDSRSIYAVRRYRSRSQLVRVSLPERTVEELPHPWGHLGELVVSPSETGMLAYTASSATAPAVVVTRSGDTETVRASSTVGLIDGDDLAPAEVVEWQTVDGTPVYGVLTRALDEAGPRPLLVMVHGGPTSETTLSWNPQAQYFASKGWHYLAVNHRGGTGSGRAYQNLLDEAWGTVDVEDARSGAEHLIAQGLVDPARVAITGGSAGGYTTLMALVRDPDFWTAGVALYGVGNLYECRIGSHRFEARYEDTLIGPLPETAPRWVERSPLTHVRVCKAPVQLFHGKEDAAVPYQQSVEFAEAVKAQGGIAELILYDDEGHGFRKERNRKDQLEKMEAFLEKYVINLQGKR